MAHRGLSRRKKSPLFQSQRFSADAVNNVVYTGTGCLTAANYQPIMICCSVDVGIYTLLLEKGGEREQLPPASGLYKRELYVASVVSSY